MTETLSQKLNLRLNNYPILLNEQINVPAMAAHDIKKVGFWGRLLLSPARKEEIYWSKAGTLKYIDDASIHSIMPANRKNSQPGDFLNTSAFLHYTHGMLSGFAFQIMNHPVKVDTIMKAFEEKIIGLIGEASAAEGLIKTWQVGHEKLILDFPEAKRNGYMHLILDK